MVALFARAMEIAASSKGEVRRGRSEITGIVSRNLQGFLASLFLPATVVLYLLELKL